MKQQSMQEKLVKNYSNLIKNTRKIQKEDPAITKEEKQRDKQVIDAMKAVLDFIEEKNYVEIVEATSSKSGLGWNELRDVYNDLYAEMIA